MTIDWLTVRKLSWRARYAQVQLAARAYLDLISRPHTCDTFDVAKGIWPQGRDVSFKRNMDELCHVLTRIAPYIGTAYATHDGETIKRYGKTWRRWRWHGQGGTDL
jgi:hypothetical protein